MRALVRNNRGMLALVVAVVAIVGIGYAVLGANNQLSIAVERVSETTPADLLVDIPSGYGALPTDSKQPLLADDLVVRVGEVIRIVNNDRQTHFVGPYVVAAGETLQQRFVRAGSLTASCSVHPSGKLTLTVLTANP